MGNLLSTDLIESDSDFHVHVDMPGVESIDIDASNGVLTISADKKIMHEIDTDIAHRVERSVGKVRRRLPLPSNADLDNATAKFVDGVLTVTVPKKSGSQAKKLAIA